MNYAKIRNLDISNGIGVRVSLFVSGCNHHCPGCFNQEEQDFNYGKEFGEAAYEEICNMLDDNVIRGLTIIGGEPLHQDIGGLLLLKRLCDVTHFEKCKDIWIYTGCIWENIEKGRSLHEDLQYELLHAANIVVDGPFVESLSDVFLKWRGSSNQRIIDVQETIMRGKVIEAKF